MRFLIIIKATAESEAGAMPEEVLLAQMADYHAALARSGVLLDGAGLLPSAVGWRIRYEGTTRSVLNGPFPLTSELVSGYTLIEARSREDALEWTRRYPNPCGAGRTAEIEVRQLAGPDDLPPFAAVERIRRLEGR